jgi:hypothetical protein
LCCLRVVEAGKLHELVCSRFVEVDKSTQHVAKLAYDFGLVVEGAFHLLLQVVEVAFVSGHELLLLGLLLLNRKCAED